MEIKDVENLALLARIDLTEEEKKKILKDMDGILSYIKSIEDADVGDVVVNHEVYNVWREDEEGKKDFDKESIIKQFPDQDNGYLKVNKIL